MECDPSRHQANHRIRNGPKAIVAFWRPESCFAGPFTDAALEVSMGSDVV